MRISDICEGREEARGEGLVIGERGRRGIGVGKVAEPDALLVKPRRRSRRAATAFDAWLIKAAGSATTKRSTDQIMAMTRGDD